MSDQDELLNIVMTIVALLDEQEATPEDRRASIEEDLESLRERREELKAILGPEGVSGFIGHRGLTE